MPAITFGKYGSRDELEQAVVRLYRQGGTLKGIALSCHIHPRSVRRILVRHGLNDSDRLPGVRQADPGPVPVPVGAVLALVGSPCWMVHCDDGDCIYHQVACG